LFIRKSDCGMVPEDLIAGEGRVEAEDPLKRARRVPSW
jgi:hypothetical protein